MIDETATISREKPTDAGLDYVVLVAEGTALVQQLSSDFWTNYNYSDPGVTILEQLCYALTELSYRAHFPVQDLLGAVGTGRVDLRRQGLHQARQIMPVNPVTANDFRRLILDRVPEVANAWFNKVPPGDAHGVVGLYRISILLPPHHCGCESECSCDDRHSHHESVVKQVLNRYGAHRALCEDYRHCRVLKKIPTRVHGDVHLDDNSDPDAVLARLLFTLGLALTPEPRRTSLKEQVEAGQTTTEIFNGPLMLRGFIADDQLMPLPQEVSVESLLALMVAVPGVLSVDDLRVQVGDDPREYTPGERIELKEGHILALESRSRADHYTLRLLYKSVMCRPNPVRVRRLLDRAWAAQRQTWPLPDQYSEVYATPVGQGADLAAYSSVQNQFPAVYGIGSYGLPSDALPARQAQAKQLKGYLMAFDQLMADYFSQLAFVRDLFSPAAGGDKTYAWQSLRPIVPDVVPLLSPGYEVELAALIAETDPVEARQSAVLDFLLSLFAEQLKPTSNISGDPNARGAQSAERLKAKQALLTQVVPATRDRGRGFDYRRPENLHAMAGLEIRCRIELALLDDGAKEAGVEVARSADEANFGQLLPPATGELIARTFLVIDAVENDFDAHARGPSPLAGKRVDAALLTALADPTRYRVGMLPETHAMTLVCQDLEGGWWQLEECRDAAHAVSMTARLVAAASEQHQRFYLVEWILLRDGLSHHERKECSFRVSAVMAASHDDKADSGWRRQARAIVRENIAAHILVEERFLGHHRMHHFRRLHEHWLHAMHHGSPERREETSRRLAHFLRHPDGSHPNRSA